MQLFIIFCASYIILIIHLIISKNTNLIKFIRNYLVFSATFNGLKLWAILKIAGEDQRIPILFMED